MTNQIEVKMIEDSISGRSRISTLQLKYHRYIHVELMTHRMLSKSCSSSRAVPIMTIISQVWNNPATPIHWGQNVSGMQAKSELSGVKLFLAKTLWNISSKVACVFALLFYYIGLHKQIGNRILEPFSFINVILTGTDFDNFFNLRIHPDAQPEICELATKMKEAMDKSYPTVIWNIDIKSDSQNYWHLPYVTKAERLNYPVETLLKISTARCARVSYNNHDGTNPSVENDIKLHDRLVGSIPIHASPSEHQATPGFDSTLYYRNFKGWVQYRDIVEQKLSTLTTR
jgi:hypothetical protein